MSSTKTASRVAYRAKMISPDGEMTSWMAYADGRTLGTVFFRNGVYSSAWDEDGRHTKRADLGRAMLRRREAADSRESMTDALTGFLAAVRNAAEVDATAGLRALADFTCLLEIDGMTSPALAQAIANAATTARQGVQA